MDEHVDPIYGAACFFDGGDVFAICGEAGGGFWGDFYDGAAWDAVEHDGEGGGVCDGFVVEVEAFLGGFVIVGADLEGCGGSGLLGGFGELDGFCGGVGSGAGDDFAAAGGEFYGEADDFDVFAAV